MPGDTAERRAEEIETAMLAIIERDGLEAATLRAAAREAGFTTGIIGHYFADRDELLARTYRRSAVVFTERLRATTAGTGAETIIAQHKEFLDERRAEHLIWVDAMLADPGVHLRAALDDVSRERRQLLKMILRSPPHHDDDEMVEIEIDAVLAAIDGLALHALVKSPNTTS